MTDAVETVEGSVTPSKIIRSAGLNRNFGLVGIVTFGMASIGLSVSGLLPFSTIAGLFPGSSLIAILTIAVIASLVHVYSYAMIGAAAPRSGADYVFSTRVLPAPLGFASSWLFVLYSALMAGTLVAFFPKVLLPIFLTAFSLITGDIQFASFARDISQTSGAILAGSLFAVVAFASMMMNPRRLQKIMLGGVVLGLIAWIVMIVIFAFTQSTGQFESAWDSLMGGTSFRTQIDLANTLGMPGSTGLGPVITAGLLMGFWVFFGYFVSTFLAGEVKSPEKNILRGSTISLVVTWLVLIIASFFLLKVVSSEWLTAESYLFLSGGSTSAMPWIPYFAMIIRPSVFLLIVLALAWTITLMQMVQMIYLYSSRIILAWAKDGVVPEILGYIHPNQHSPIIALLIVALLSQFGLAIAAAEGVVVPQMIFIIVTAFSQVIPVLSLILFPFLKRDWFENSPAIVKRKLLGIPLVSIIGTITLAYLIWIVIGSVSLPVMGIPFTFSTLIFVAAVFILGLIVYFYAFFTSRSRGNSISEKYRVLPPE